MSQIVLSENSPKDMLALAYSVYKLVEQVFFLCVKLIHTFV